MVTISVTVTLSIIEIRSMVTISVDGGDDLLLRLGHLAIAVDGFDGDDDDRELLGVMDRLDVNGFNSDDDDRELLGAMGGLIDGDDDHELLGDMDRLVDDGFDSDDDGDNGLILTLWSDRLEL